MVKITTIGGYSEVGKNMTAIQYKKEAVILDMGLHLESYIQLTDEEEQDNLTMRDLTIAGAIPNDSVINKIKKKVLAIIPSHAHLDHIGAIPYMAAKYDAPIICTPYTASVLKAILKDNKIALHNEIIVLENGQKKQLSNFLTVEFVAVTHSIPHTAIVVIHTPEGQVVYANDFKLDNNPVFGPIPDYERIKMLGKEGKVNALILDSLYAYKPRKTPSENIAREMLKDVMLNIDSKNKAVIVTTFSSHIARLKSIIDFGKEMKRKIVFMGRSLAKYVYAAEDIGLVDFSKHVEIIPWKSKVKKKLRDIEKEGRDKYIVVCTGHQGEPGSVLQEIANKKIGFKLFEQDHVIFSCSVIPSPVNIANRQALENNLKLSKVRIFRGIHQSGHASREDHRDFINMVKPKHIIPAHASIEKTVHMAELAKEMGYKLGKTVHLMNDGQRLEL